MFFFLVILLLAIVLCNMFKFQGDRYLLGSSNSRHMFAPIIQATQTIRSLAKGAGASRAIQDPCWLISLLIIIILFVSIILPSSQRDWENSRFMCVAIIQFYVCIIVISKRGVPFEEFKSPVC